MISHLPTSASPIRFFFLIFRRPPTSTLFPYTTLFRSSLTRRQHHDAGAAAHLALELLRIGLDHVPCIVMYRNHRAGLHELHGAYRVFDAHRVVVADRDEHRVHAPGEQLHLHGEARVPTVIHGAPTHHDDHPAGVGRELARRVSLHGPSVERGHELDPTEGELPGAE